MMLSRRMPEGRPQRSKVAYRRGGRVGPWTGITKP